MTPLPPPAMPNPPADGWPDLSAIAPGPTLETLHLWSQIVGKVRLMKTPWVNHGWHVPLYVSARGLATGLIPDGTRGFEMEFDLLAASLTIRTTDGTERAVALRPQSVAAFYAAVMDGLRELGIAVRLNEMPSEIADAVPFSRDHAARVYDNAAALVFWRALVQAQRVFQLFRSRFVGKCSPIHFFWGSFDLAVTRFSGRAAPAHAGGVPHLPDAVAREAYCQEVSSAGFWPGGAGMPAGFYSYVYPVPDGFAEAAVRPAGAAYHSQLGEFVISYDDIRTSPDPDQALLGFLQSTYKAAANLGRWERQTLERAQGELGHPPPGS